MTDHARGACGDMPSCHSADIIVDMWDLLEIGKADIAMDIYEKILLLLDFENVYRLYAYKEILSRRGIIKTNKCRPQPPGWFGAAQPIDKHGSEELDMILAHVSPYFRVK